MAQDSPRNPGYDNGVDNVSSSTSQLSHKTTGLSNKLTSVLAASFADSEIREALSELDGRHILNTAALRRRMRTDLQKEVIDCNGDIVKELGLVAVTLKRVGSTIARLDKLCEDERKAIAAAQRETAPILEETAILVSQRNEVENKSTLLKALNRHFGLTEDERDVLATLSFSVDERFFSLLSKLKRIHADCETLLGSDDQQLGMELMERSSKELDSAFQKLFKWIKREFEGLDLENPRMSISIRRALRVLAERPSLFEACLDHFAEAREHNLSEAFYAARTGFSTQNDDRTAKPMEYYAHDSVRFVGDMLAWTHSAAVSERESLEVLFISEGDEMAAGIRAGLDSEPWHESSDGRTDFDGRAALKQLVNRDMAGVTRALRQRIEQVIRGDEDAVLAYRIAHLIGFYCITFERLLGAGADLTHMLSALQDGAMSRFRSLVSENAQALPIKISAGVLVLPEDLSAPGFLIDAMSLLQQIMKTFDTSFVSAGSREAEFDSTLDLCLEPYIKACAALSSSTDGALHDPSSSIFMSNVLRIVMPVLARYEFTSAKLETYRARARAVQEGLVEHQFDFLMQHSGLRPLHEALMSLSLEDASDIARLATLESCKPSQLAAASKALDEFLPDALVEAQEQLQLLQDKSTAEAATNEAAGRFCEVFDQIEERLVAADAMALGELGDDDSKREPTNGQKPRLKDLFPRTGAELRVLLS